MPVQIIFILVVAVAVLLMTGGGSDHFDKAFLASAQGNHEAAIAYYTRALESGDLSRANRARALNNRAIAYDQKAMYQQALDDYQEAMAIAPQDLEILRNRSETMQRAESVRADPFGRQLVQVSSMRMGDSAQVAAGLRVKEKQKILGIL